MLTQIHPEIGLTGPNEELKQNDAKWIWWLVVQFKRSPFGHQWYAMVCLPTVGCNTLQLFGHDILHVLVRITSLSLSPQVDSNKPAALSGPRPQGVSNIRPEKAASCKLSLSRLMVLQDPSSLKAGWKYMAVILACTCSSGIKNMWYKQLEAPDLWSSKALHK